MEVRCGVGFGDGGADVELVVLRETAARPNTGTMRRPVSVTIDAPLPRNKAYELYETRSLHHGIYRDGMVMASVHSPACGQRVICFVPLSGLIEKLWSGLLPAYTETPRPHRDAHKCAHGFVDFRFSNFAVYG